MNQVHDKDMAERKELTKRMNKNIIQREGEKPELLQLDHLGICGMT